MKPQFFLLPDEKRERILEACFSEFAQGDFDEARLDRIVRAARISKGGLYEYIESKEDLYLHVIEQVYGRLYGVLEAGDLPEDLVERFRAVSARAVDFYLDHPRCIAIITRSSRLSHPDLAAQVEGIFQQHFARLFGTVDPDRLAFPVSRLLELMKWLLAKTRNDFLSGLAQGGGRSSQRAAYLEDWEFLLTILKKGIYR